MPSAVSDLKDHTGYWLRMVSNAVSQEFARKVSSEGVTVAEWVFLRSLHARQGIAPTVLAEQMGMTRGAISKLADRLVAKGLCVRAESDPGGRGQALSLTPAGMEKVPVLARLADANDAEFFGVLADPDRAALDRLLKTLAAKRGLGKAPVG